MWVDILNAYNSSERLFFVCLLRLNKTDSTSFTFNIKGVSNDVLPSKRISNKPAKSKQIHINTIYSKYTWMVGCSKVSHPLFSRGDDHSGTTNNNGSASATCWCQQLCGRWKCNDLGLVAMKTPPSGSSYLFLELGRPHISK